MTPRCPLGQSLYLDWSRAVANHAYPDVIYDSTKAYFTHRNTCPGCSSPQVREMYRYNRKVAEKVKP